MVKLSGGIAPWQPERNAKNPARCPPGLHTHVFQITLFATSRSSTQSKFLDCLTEPAMPELLVDDVHTYYGDSYVLQGVSLSMAKGAGRVDGERANAADLSRDRRAVGGLAPGILIDESLSREFVKRARSRRTKSHWLAQYPLVRGLLPTPLLQNAFIDLSCPVSRASILIDRRMALSLLLFMIYGGW